MILSGVLLQVIILSTFFYRWLKTGVSVISVAFYYVARSFLSECTLNSHHSLPDDSKECSGDKFSLALDFEKLIKFISASEKDSFLFKLKSS
jgi:hypothetical protein